MKKTQHERAVARHESSCSDTALDISGDVYFTILKITFDLTPELLNSYTPILLNSFNLCCHSHLV